MTDTNEMQGGVQLSTGERLVPDPVLVGRNAAKLERLAEATGLQRALLLFLGTLAGWVPAQVGPLRTDLALLGALGALALGSVLYRRRARIPVSAQ